MEKKDVLNRLIYILIFAIGSFLLEIIAFTTMGFGVLPKYILFDIAFIMIISAILFLIKSRRAKLILTIIIISIQVVINCVNVCYYKALGDIFSFDLLTIGEEAAKAFNLSFIHWPSIVLNALALTLIIKSLSQFTKHDKKPKNFRYQRFSSFAILMSLFMFISFSGVSTKIIAESTLAEISAEDTFYVAKSDNYLYENFHFKQEAFKKFGTFGFYIKSVSNLVNYGNIDLLEKKELKEYANSNIVAANPNATLYGNNLIVIMLESFEWFAIDPILTPTLYSLKTGEAQTFTNFRARNKTNVSETISILGNAPKRADLMILGNKDDFAPSNSLAYKFRDIGYTSNYFHSFDKTFYQRHKTNKSFGFEHIYGLQDINYKIPDFGNFYLEEDYISKVIDYMVPTDEKFFSFYTTVGTHGPHTDFNPRYSEYFELYEEKLPEIKYYLESQGFHFPTSKDNYKRLKEYKCAAMDTDRMIKFLIEDLENKNLLDTTTIVLYADHNSYYDDLNLFIRYNTNVVDPNKSDSHNIPFMIYDQTLGGGSIDTFCNTYDIYPTICELFGLEYSKNLTQGYNVYSQEIENSLFVSNLTAMFTDKLYSYNINEVIDFSGENISDDEILKFQLNAIKFYEKQDKIDKIYINMLNKHS